MTSVIEIMTIEQKVIEAVFNELSVWHNDIKQDNATLSLTKDLQWIIAVLSNYCTLYDNIGLFAGAQIPLPKIDNIIKHLIQLAEQQLTYGLSLSDEQR